MLFYDFECFKYDWMVVIKDTSNRVTHKIHNDPEALTKIYEDNKDNIWVGYNSRSYDQYLLKGILLGMSPQDINNWIIVLDNPGWSFSREFNRIKLYNFDIMTDITKGLKQLEGFMGNDIRETTVDFTIDRPLTKEEIEEVFFYCNHDVEQTMEVFINRKEEFETNLNVIKLFKLSLNNINKTQTQLAAIVLGAVRQERDDEFNITIADTIKLNRYKFVQDWYTNPLNRDYKKSLNIEVEGAPHSFGWGGLHGAKTQYQGEGIFVNSDVGSFYPSLMIQYKFLSRNVLDPSKYEDIYNTRMTLKHAGKKKEQVPYKLLLNKTYGASKDVHNAMYDPLMANNVCINGQLMLLDLIEHVTDKIPDAVLIQSNTDGVMFKLPNIESLDVYKAVADEWSARTRMNLEHDFIKKVVQKDVNNYIVVMENGKVKSKGAYVKPLDKLDNDLPILNKALMDYFTKGVPVEETINNSKYLIDFQRVVKISSKYSAAYYGNEKMTEKVFRVFASKNYIDPGLFKLSKTTSKLAKVENTPEHCFIDNGDINGKRISRRLDKQYYIDMARKRVEDFVGSETNQISLFD